MATPKILMNNLLDTYANFMEDQITDNERDLTEQEIAERGGNQGGAAGM